MAVRLSKAVQQLSSATQRTERCPSVIGPINLEAKQMGARSAGNPHAACDVEGAGNVAWSRCWDTRRRKGEPTGNPNFDLNRRASPRPYLGVDPLGLVGALGLQVKLGQIASGHGKGRVA